MGASDPVGDGAQRSIALAVVFKAVFEHHHADRFASIEAFETRLGRGQAPVATRVLRNGGKARRKRTASSSRHVSRKLRRTRKLALTQRSIRLRLQTPGETPYQVGAVGSARPLLKARPKLCFELFRTEPVQARDLHLKCSVQVVRPL